MGTVSDLIAEIQQSFDVTPTDALAVLNRRHKQMCSRARWWREMRTTATLDAPATGAVSLVIMPADIVELYFVQTHGTDPAISDVIYTRTQQWDVPAIDAGTAVVSGGGVFYEHPPTSNSTLTPTSNILLYPKLEAGSTVFLYGAYTPPDLETVEPALAGGFIRVPADFHDALLFGVYASLLARPNEARPDLANQQEALFGAACDELRDRANRRYRAKGPRQIRIAV